MTDALELLVIDQQPERAEEINSLLRNSGINVHISRAASRQQAENALSASDFDLVLGNPGCFDCMPSRELFTLASRYRVEVALRADPADAGPITGALRSGRFMAIGIDDAQQLVAYIKKRWEDKRFNRDMQTSQFRYEELELRYRALLERSPEATAYLHEGLHVFANRAYLDMLGANDLSSISTTSLIELARSQTVELKKLLRDMVTGLVPDEPVPVSIETPDRRFEASLTFSTARYEGEDCVQMVVHPEIAPGKSNDLHRPSGFSCAVGNAIVGPLAEEKEPDHESTRWSEKIRRALNGDDLFIVQQSIIDLEGESEGMFECHAYLDDEGKQVPVESLLEHAEELDLGASIDRHLIPGVLNSVAGSTNRYIINISENSLLDFSFPGWLHRQMEDLDVQGNQIIVQVRATTAAANGKQFARLVEELHNHGCGIALSLFDDQQDLRHILNRFEIGWVKLRPELAAGIANQPENQSIVRQATQMAEQASAVVIADGVRDAADMAMLWQCGVKLVSGEFFQESPQVAAQ